MNAVRHLLAQRRLAMLLCLATLLLKILVPAGYMIAGGGGSIEITICSGVAPRTMTIEVPGMHGGMAGHGKSQDHGKAEMPCAFSGLSAPALGAMDPILLVALFAYIMALGRGAATLPACVPPAYLRPPLRGPPARL